MNINTNINMKINTITNMTIYMTISVTIKVSAKNMNILVSAGFLKVAIKNTNMIAVTYSFKGIN